MHAARAKGTLKSRHFVCDHMLLQLRGRTINHCFRCISIRSSLLQRLMKCYKKWIRWFNKTSSLKNKIAS